MALGQVAPANSYADAKTKIAIGDKTWFHLRLSEIKASVCVSTVSIIGGSNGSPPNRARADQIGMTVVVADAADGADGVCGHMHPDDPASGAAFSTKGNFDAHGA